MSKNTTKKLALYAALYRDRGETVKELPEQLLGIRESGRGQTLAGVFVDVILSPSQAAEAKSVTLAVEDLVHAIWADETVPVFYVVALVVASKRDDPRDDPNSARSMAIKAIGPDGDEILGLEAGGYLAGPDGLVRDSTPD
jgi:hypothetical protein